MLVITFFLACSIINGVLLAPTDEEDGENVNIADGNVVKDISHYPYMVAVMLMLTAFIEDRTAVTNRYRQDCGGSIISPRFVLSAKHCFTTPGERFIRAGVANCMDKKHAQDQQILAVAAHPVGDIAVVKLHGAFEFNDFVKAIPLTMAKPSPGTKCIVTGYGIHDENGHHDKNFLKQAINEFKYLLDDKILVTKEESTTGHICNGDSGSPLSCNGKLVGIANSVWKGPCSDAMSVYTSTTRYIDWLNEFNVDMDF